MSRRQRSMIVLILAVLPWLPWPQLQAGNVIEPQPHLGDVDEAIRRAQDYLISLQLDDGSWDGNCIFHTDTEPDHDGITSLYVLFLTHIGVDNPNRRQAVEYLVHSQRPDGAWGDLIAMTTYLGALAIEVSGESIDPVTLQRAHEFLERQAVPLKDAWYYPQLFYALFDKASWDEFDCPALGEGLEASQSERPNEFSLDLTLSFPIIKTLHAEGGPTREQFRLLRRAEKLLLERQWPDGSWFSNEYSTICSLLALYELGYEKNEEAFVRGMQYLASLQNENGSVDLFSMPVFGTAEALLALEASGSDMSTQRIQDAKQWLVEGRDLATGGWAYIPGSGGFNDIDSTAFCATVVADYDSAVTQEAVAFILLRQSQDGGWATYSRDFEPEHYNVEWFPSRMEYVFFGDPSTADETGHALFALGREGYTVEDPRVQRAVSYLQRVQLDEGMWFAWWAIPFLYGTRAALMGLDAVGTDMSAPYVQKAVDWLKNCQNPDGGWGEDWKSTEDLAYACQGDSTPIQTAWAILGLLAADVPPDAEAIQRGISYILARQRDSGNWDPYHTSVALAQIRYAMEPAETVWPLWALSAYRSASGDATETHTLPLWGRIGLGTLAGLVLSLVVLAGRNKSAFRRRR